MNASSLVGGNRTGKLGLSILLGLMVSVPAVVLLGRLQAQRLESMQMRQSDHLGLLVAREVASEIGRVVDDYGYAIEALAGQVQARGASDLRSLEKMVAAQRASFLPYASHLFVSDAEGKILVADPPEGRAGRFETGSSIRDRGEYQEALRSGKIAIAHSQLEKDSRLSVVQMAAPIYDSRQTLEAFSGGALDIDSIQSQVEQIVAGVPELNVVVLNQAGQAIAHSRKNPAVEGEDLPRLPLYFPPAGSREEMRNGVDEKGVPVRASVVSITEREMNWTVVSYRAESYIQARIVGAKRKIFFLVGAGFAAGLVFTCLAFWLHLKNPMRGRFGMPAQIAFLVSLLTIVCLPVGLLGRSQNGFLKSVLIEQIDQEGILAAKVISRNIGQQIDRSVRVIEAMAGQVGAYGSLEPKTLQQIVTTQRSIFPGFTLMYIGNAKGTSVAADPPFDKFGMPLAGTDYSDRDYYKEVSSTGRSFVGPVRIGRRSHVPNIQIGSPVLDQEGKFWAFTEGSVDLLDNISPQVERLIAGIPELTAVVTDREGRVVAHPEKEARQQIIDLNQFSLFRSIKRLEGEVRTDVNERGTPVRAVAAPILTRDLNWRVVVYRPEGYIQAQNAIAERQTWLMVGIGLLPGLLFIAFSIYEMKRPAFPRVASPQYHV